LWEKRRTIYSTFPNGETTNEAGCSSARAPSSIKGTKGETYRGKRDLAKGVWLIRFVRMPFEVIGNPQEKKKTMMATQKLREGDTQKKPLDVKKRMEKRRTCD